MTQYALRVGGNSEIKRWLFPFLFVSIYGSGFAGAKLSLPDSSPLTFLSIRFLLAGFILLVIAFIAKDQLPSLREFFHISIAGSLTVAVFTIGVFESIDSGLSPAISALIIGLQPVMVSVFARKMVNESLNIFQWIGLALGLVGVGIVVSSNIDSSKASALSIVLSFVALIGLTFGTLYQKKYCATMNVFIGGSIQSLVSGVICLILLVVFQDYRLTFTTNFFIALVHMSIGISIGALTILYLMIRDGNVSKVASVFYLVPVSAAISGYLVFGETFEGSTIFGASVVLLGVFLTNYGGKKLSLGSPRSGI